MKELFVKLFNLLSVICAKPQSKQEDAEAGKVSGEHQKGAPEKEKEGQGSTVQLLGSASHPRSAGRSFSSLKDCRMRFVILKLKDKASQFNFSALHLINEPQVGGRSHP
jgi:hypothetical protein